MKEYTLYYNSLLEEYTFVDGKNLSHSSRKDFDKNYDVLRFLSLELDLKRNSILNINSEMIPIIKSELEKMVKSTKVKIVVSS